jgi:recombination protein RecA
MLRSAALEALPPSLRAHVAFADPALEGEASRGEPRLGEVRAKALSLDGWREREGASEHRGRAEGEAPNLDAVLPDGGLPRGAVVELAAPGALGHATTIALRAIAAAQSEARLRSGDPRTVGAWCALLDPWSTLHAPALEGHGIDASRLLVVRPDVDALARVAVRVAESRAFALVVVDTACVPGAERAEGGRLASSVRLERWGTVVRRLALAVERTDTTIVLVTDGLAKRVSPLPVALRLELARRPGWSIDGASSAAGELAPRLVVRVAKERSGRVRAPVAVAAG